MAECKICNLEITSGTGEFCVQCKNPAKISGYCDGCGNRFDLTIEQLAEIIKLQPEISHITPELGLTVVTSTCDVCYGEMKKPPPSVKIF